MTTISHLSMPSPARREPRRFRTAWLAALAVIASVLTSIALPAAPASADATFNQRMLELVNQARGAAGVNPVVMVEGLRAIAEDAPYNGCGFPVEGRAKDMGQRNYFSHAISGCPNQSVFNMLAASGMTYSGAAENIAWMNGTTSPITAAENLHSQLMNSPGHRANILNANHNAIGIGSWNSSPGQSWTGANFPLQNVWIVAEVFTNMQGATASAGRYTSLPPSRILDTRLGIGLPGAIGPAAAPDVQVTGRGGVPASGVTSVVMNVTVTQPTADGYLTVYPSGSTRPPTSSLNFTPNKTVANLVVAKLGTSGRVSMFNAAGSTHVISDVVGYFTDGGTGNAGRYQPLPPARIADTRFGIGGVRLAPGASFDVQVTGQGAVPLQGVQAAVLNVAVTNTTAAGFLTVYPTGQARPDASSLNFNANETVSNRVMAKLGSNGRVTVFNSAGSTDVVVDVGGWFTDATVAGSNGLYSAIAPARILDTRLGIGLSGAIAGNTTVDVQVAGVGGVPSTGVQAVVLNATSVGPAANGWLTVFPKGTAQPAASDLNYAAGETRNNLVVAQVGTGGKASLYTSATTHVIYDVVGWLS